MTTILATVRNPKRKRGSTGHHSPEKRSHQSDKTVELPFEALCRLFEDLHIPLHSEPTLALEEHDTDRQTRHSGTRSLDDQSLPNSANTQLQDISQDHVYSQQHAKGRVPWIGQQSFATLPRQMGCLTALPDLIDCNESYASQQLDLNIPTVDKPPVENKLIRAPTEFLTAHNRTVVPALRSLLPASATEASVRRGSLGRCRMDYLKVLLYAATNNYAGLDVSVMPEMMFKFLKPVALQLIENMPSGMSGRQMFLEVPSLKPMAEMLFKSAIEVGDDTAVAGLLSWKDAGLDVDSLVYSIPGKAIRYLTPLERSAHLQHLAVTRRLLDFGADVNRTHQQSCWCALHYCESGPSQIGRSPQGALEWAVHPPEEQSLGSPDPSLVALLLQSGSQIHPELIESDDCFSHLLYGLLRVRNERIVEQLVSAFAANHHMALMRCTFVHTMMSEMGSAVRRALVREMYKAGADLNFRHESKSYAGHSHLLYDESNCPPPTLIDIAAWKGDASTVRLLLRLRACVTEDTSPAAILSQDRDTVSLLHAAGLLDHHGFSRYFRSTAFASSLITGNLDLMNMALIPTDWRSLARESLGAILVATSRTGDVESTKRALRCRASFQSIEGFQEFDAAALSAAVSNNDLDMAELLLRGGLWKTIKDLDVLDSDLAARNHFSSDSVNGLVAALRHRNTRMVQALVEYRTCTSDDGESVSEAIRSGQLAAANDLLNAGVPLGNSLAFAIENGDHQSIQLLLSRGADVDSGGGLPLAAAVRMQNHQVMRLLLDHGADPANTEALCIATRRTSPCLPTLLDAFAMRYPRGKGGFGAEVVIAAIRAKRPALIQKLIDFHFNLNKLCTEFTGTVKSSDDQICLAPLAVAIQGTHNDHAIVQLLLDAGCDPNTVVRRQHRHTWTPLLEAISIENLGLLKLLLAAGANVNHPASWMTHHTPLQLAASLPSMKVVQILLDHGADVNGAPATWMGGTALQWAATGGYVGIALLLLQNGADLTHPGSPTRRWTPLESAALAGRFDMAYFLAQYGPHHQSEYDRSIEVAKGNGHPALAIMLERILQENAMPEPEANALHYCKDCEKSFSKQSAFKRHRQTRHESPSAQHLYSCSHCDFKHARMDTVKRHQMTHDETLKDPCRLCGKRFRSDYLREHQKVCHRL